MISLIEMQEIADAEKEAEIKARQAKYQKDLAVYRDRVKNVRQPFIEYIQAAIINSLKCGCKTANLYKTPVAEIFASVLNSRYHDSYEILWHLYDPERPTLNAYNKALQELAISVREELFAAGVKDIIKGGPFVGDPEIILVLK